MPVEDVDLVEGIIAAIAEATTKTVARVRATVGRAGGGMGASKSSLITPLSARLFQLIATPRAVLLSFYRAVLPPTSCTRLDRGVHRGIQGNDARRVRFSMKLFVFPIGERLKSRIWGSNEYDMLIFILEIGSGRITRSRWIGLRGMFRGIRGKFVEFF